MKLVAFLLSMLFIVNINAQSTTTYTASTKHILNPGRGFYAHAEYGWGTAGQSNTTLTAAYLNTLRDTDSVTLILRLYYMGSFKNTAITAAALSLMNNDMALLRSSGIKCIIRFAYGKTQNVHNHNDDASKTQVWAHLNQLKPFFQNNSDVILTTQIGFIGTYGEWFYTHPDFSLSDGNPEYPNRKAVSDSLLKIIPPHKQMQIRTAYYKYNSAMYGNGTSGTAQALTAAQAYTNTAKARIGHHNDCFLANSTDYGTYIDLVEDKNYLEQDTKYTFNGGETCNQDPTYTNCTNAQAEMDRFHFSYLNRDYNTTVIDYWKTNNCYNAIRRNLGYRLELINATYTNTASQSYAFNVNINLRNVGYASPYEQKRFELILKNTSTNTEYPITLSGIDNRFWLSGTTYNITKQVGIGTLANGTYNLYLAIKDTASGLVTNSKFNIQFANTGTWEDASGYNLLKVVTVNNSVNPGTGTYSGSDWFGPSAVLSNGLINFTGTKAYNKASLQWTVANSQQFESLVLERSNDGSNYYTIQNYFLPIQQQFSFVDANQLNTTTTYYRLLLKQKNGTTIHSNIIKLNGTGVVTNAMQIFPTPAKSYINVNITSSQLVNATLHIIDAQGKQVKDVQKIVLSNGQNSIQNINIQDLPKGIYYVLCKTMAQTLTTNFIKE